MTDNDKKKPDEDVEPTVLEEPKTQDAPHGIDRTDDENNVWMRGLYMLILGLLFEFGRAALWIAAVLQFLWLLFGKEKNQPIADFGKGLADWLARVARFQTGATEEKPFPFAKWGKVD